MKLCITRPIKTFRVFDHENNFDCKKLLILCLIVYLTFGPLRSMGIYREFKSKLIHYWPFLGGSVVVVLCYLFLVSEFR